MTVVAMAVRRLLDSADPAEQRAFRQAALVVGAIATTGAVLALVVTEVSSKVLGGALGLEPMEAIEIVGVVGEATWFLIRTVLPWLAVLVSFYLTAGRDHPAAATAAGAFVGCVPAIAGHAFMAGVWGSRIQFATSRAIEYGAEWTIRLVVPVLLAILLGAVVDGLWERGERWFGRPAEQ